MPDSGIADGATFSSAFWDSYVREQVCVTCTSSTRPTNVEGRLIYETDTDRLMLGTGSGTNWVVMGEPITTWSPTFGGITVGSGTTNGGYRRLDGSCRLSASFVFGSGSSITSGITLTLPFASAVSSGPCGLRAYILDSGTQWYDAMVYHDASSTVVKIDALGTASTYGGRVTTSSTVPMTWTTNDAVYVEGLYSMATRYTTF